MKTKTLTSLAESKQQKLILNYLNQYNNRASHNWPEEASAARRITFGKQVPNDISAYYHFPRQFSYCSIPRQESNRSILWRHSKVSQREEKERFSKGHLSISVRSQLRISFCSEWKKIPISGGFSCFSSVKLISAHRLAAVNHHLPRQGPESCLIQCNREPLAERVCGEHNFGRGLGCRIRWEGSHLPGRR